MDPPLKRLKKFLRTCDTTIKISCVGPIYVHVGYSLHTEIFDFVLLPFRPWTPVFALLEHKYIDKKVRGSLDRFNYMYDVGP